MRLRPAVPCAVSVVAAALLATAVPATASAATPWGSGPRDRAAVLSSWTQPTAASRTAWTKARTDEAAWAKYGFDWSTDYCTDSPDRPFGFDFSLACARHDFGHRNYTAIGQFGANKDRIDTGFYDDMKAVCARLSPVRRTMCGVVAFTYYEAARGFGSIGLVDQPAKRSVA
jgi:hypothetical protein